jgi:hypothetical protein
MEPLILPALYLAPIPYFQAIKRNEGRFTIEKHEHFRKQTYRNRTTIYSANGKLDLTIPIKHRSLGNMPMKDVRISYDFAWQRQHWLSIQTAYRSSAYFEYYEDDFRPFFEKEFPFLLDFNIAQTELLLKLSKVNVSFDTTEAYVELPETIEKDFRSTIHPRKELPFETPNYYQVFGDRHGFIPGLSMIDLLFNQGPRTWEII